MDADLFRTRWPGLWSLLTTRGSTLPAALRTYTDDGPQGTGARWLDVAERQVQYLFRRCGARDVRDVYRGRMSGLRVEHQLTALLCEIHVCASVARPCSDFALVRPRRGKRTPEFEAVLEGQRLYGEVKRYAWKEGEGEEADIKEVRNGVDLRGWALARKLDDDLRPKFIAGTVNLGFVYRSSLGDVFPPRAFRQTLLGTRSGTSSPAILERSSEEDLRFALRLAYNMPGWEVVSGIFLVRLAPRLCGEGYAAEAQWFSNPCATAPLCRELAARIKHAWVQVPVE